jgi:hypothetical protein
VHRARDGRARHEIAAELRKDDSLAHRARLVPGAPDPLHPAGHRRRRFDLDDQIDCAHVDAELERGRGDERLDASGFEQILHLAACLASQRAVCERDRLAGQIVERIGRRSPAAGCSRTAAWTDASESTPADG